MAAILTNLQRTVLTGFVLALVLCATPAHALDRVVREHERRRHVLLLGVEEAHADRTEPLVSRVLPTE